MEVSEVQMKRAINVILFYIVSFTWGILMSSIGAIVGLVLMCCGVKPRLFYHVVYFEVGKGWGGLELGCFFICGKGSSKQLKQHEAGHGFQNAWFGPFMPFIVTIPSAFRYWLYEIKRENHNFYAFIVWLCATVLGLAVVGIGFGIFNSWWFFGIGLAIVFYFSLLCAWAYFIEIPKHKNGYVVYDSIWFEGQASSLGAKYFK